MKKRLKMLFTNVLILLIVVYFCVGQQLTEKDPQSTDSSKQHSRRFHSGRRWSSNSRNSHYQRVVFNSEHEVLESKDIQSNVTKAAEKSEQSTENSKKSALLMSQNTIDPQVSLDILNKINNTRHYVDFGRYRNHKDDSVNSPRKRRISTESFWEQSTLSQNNKRQRIPTIPTTTNVPQTMSYSLVHYFRPLEDVPQDDILPFLDFGRKLSPVVPTPSGINSIENKSTGNSNRIHLTESSVALTDDDSIQDEMDLNFDRRVVEKNSVPHGRLHLSPNISNLYRKPISLTTADNLIITSNCASQASLTNNTKFKNHPRIQDRQFESRKNISICGIAEAENITQRNMHTDVEDNSKKIKVVEILSNIKIPYKSSELKLDSLKSHSAISPESSNVKVVFKDVQGSDLFKSDTKVNITINSNFTSSFNSSTPRAYLNNNKPQDLLEQIKNVPREHISHSGGKPTVRYRNVSKTSHYEMLVNSTYRLNSSHISSETTKDRVQTNPFRHSLRQSALTKKSVHGPLMYFHVGNITIPNSALTNKTKSDVRELPIIQNIGDSAEYNLNHVKNTTIYEINNPQAVNPTSISNSQNSKLLSPAVVTSVSTEEYSNSSATSTEPQIKSDDFKLNDTNVIGEWRQRIRPQVRGKNLTSYDKTNHQLHLGDVLAKADRSKKKSEWSEPDRKPSKTHLKSSATPMVPVISTTTTATPMVPVISTTTTATPMVPVISTTTTATPMVPEISTTTTATPMVPVISTTTTATPMVPVISTITTASTVNHTPEITLLQASNLTITTSPNAASIHSSATQPIPSTLPTTSLSSTPLTTTISAPTKPLLPTISTTLKLLVHHSSTAEGLSQNWLLHSELTTTENNPLTHESTPISSVLPVTESVVNLNTSDFSNVTNEKAIDSRNSAESNIQSHMVFDTTVVPNTELPFELISTEELPFFETTLSALITTPTEETTLPKEDNVIFPDTVSPTTFIPSSKNKAYDQETAMVNKEKDSNREADTTQKPHTLVITGHSYDEEDVKVAYQQGIGVTTYILVFLAVVPIVLGAAVAGRFLVLHSRKKVLDESEYSSEYNRSPLGISAASPLPTKLPRVPTQLGWEMEKSAPCILPITSTRWEFPREKLRLQTLLGQGNFGQVWKAEADDVSGHEGLTRLVAVKTVKESANMREREDLLRELGIMQDLGSHPNVVTLLGCCTEKEPYFLIMEYVMYGKLLSFLRDHRTRAHYYNFSDVTDALTSRDLTVFAYCVARGMDYLSNKGIIHRDLAARNILVDHNKLCKIADFGMSRNVKDTGQIYEQRQSKGALPIRWMAPESLHLSLFTHKSDVWSFGILMWEIVTLGSTPYATMGARDVMKRVRDGYRLEKPSHCRVELFRVISRCWHSDPNKRPTFSELKLEIGQLLSNSENGGCYVDLESLADEIKQGMFNSSSLQRNH